MKNRTSLLSISIVVLAALTGILAACTPSGSAPEQGVVEPTQSTDAAQPEVVTMFVGPELVECTGVAPQMCMQVKNSPDEEYSLFYSQIDGFTFEPGYEYELSVEVTPVDNPPADGSSLSYRLVEIVSQTAVESAGMAEAPELEGTRWVLVEYLNSQGETVQAIADVEATAEFSEGTISGRGSCNSYSGSYTVDGNTLTISPLASTMMACIPDEAMQQEADFLANLQSAATYSIEGDHLMIANADGDTILTFVATEPISLTSVTWSAVNYNNGNQAVVSLLADTTITAVFAEDGTLSGSAGCNTYTTSYTVDGDSMTIAPAATTRMMCEQPEGVMDQEAQYLSALETTATYRIDGNTLTLRTADGAMVANFVVEEAMP
ncbi:MAG: META domain-containing protein [Chloroflexota bacterium]